MLEKGKHETIIMQQETNTMIPYLYAITTIRHLFDIYIHVNRLNNNYSNGSHLIYFFPLAIYDAREKES